MKKHWKVLLAVGLVAVMAVGAIGSAAWFTDAEVISDNYVTTGSLDLEVGGGSLVATNLEPGADYTSAGYFYAKNVGNYDMKWRGHMKVTLNENGLAQYLRVRCILNPDASHQGNYGPTGPTQLFTGVPFTDLMPWNSHILLDDTTTSDPFEPGHYAWYEVLVRLDSSAPDAVQNSRVDAKLHFGATQWINGGWGQ